MTTDRQHPTGSSPIDDLAPHLEPDWTEELVLELRLRGVSGPRIGEVLLEADAHCLDSGQSAEAAFGDPTTYARDLDLPVRHDSAASVLRGVAPMILQVLGMLALLWSLDAWRRDELLRLTTGDLTVLALLLAVVAMLVVRADPMLRVVIRHPVAGWFAFMAHLAVIVTILLVLDGPVGDVSSGWGVASGALMLVTGLLWALVRRRRGPSVDDPLRSPFDDGAGPTLGRPARLRWLETAGTLLIPAFTLLMSSVIWWTTR